MRQQVAHPRLLPPRIVTDNIESDTHFSHRGLHTLVESSPVTRRKLCKQLKQPLICRTWLPIFLKNVMPGRISSVCRIWMSGRCRENHGRNNLRSFDRLQQSFVFFVWRRFEIGPLVSFSIVVIADNADVYRLRYGPVAAARSSDEFCRRP